jgi:hypothetical protein
MGDRESTWGDVGVSGSGGAEAASDFGVVPVGLSACAVVDPFTVPGTFKLFAFGSSKTS